MAGTIRRRAPCLQRRVQWLHITKKCPKIYRAPFLAFSGFRRYAAGKQQRCFTNPLKAQLCTKKSIGKGYSIVDPKHIVRHTINTPSNNDNFRDVQPLKPPVNSVSKKTRSKTNMSIQLMCCITNMLCCA